MTANGQMLNTRSGQDTLVCGVYHKDVLSGLPYSSKCSLYKSVHDLEHSGFRANAWKSRAERNEKMLATLET